MTLLHKALAEDYRHAPAMARDTACDPLRIRLDFQLRWLRGVRSDGFAGSDPVNGFREDVFPGRVRGNPSSLVRVSRSRVLAVIQEPFGDDALVTPMKADGPALPGAKEGYTAPLERRLGIVCARSRHPLADHDSPGPGPGVKPGGIRRLGAVVR